MARKPKPKGGLGVQVRAARRAKELGTHSERLRALFANKKETDRALEVLRQYALELDASKPDADAAPAPVLKALQELPAGRRLELFNLLEESDPELPVHNLRQPLTEELPEPDLEQIKEEAAKERKQKSGAMTGEFGRTFNEEYARKFGLAEDPSSLSDQQLIDTVARHRKAQYESGRLGVLAGDTTKGEKGRPETLSPLQRADNAIREDRSGGDPLTDQKREDLVKRIIGKGADKEFQKKRAAVARATGEEIRPYGQGGAEAGLTLPRVVQTRPKGVRGILRGLTEESAGAGATPFSGSAQDKTYKHLLEVRRHLEETGELMDYRVLVNKEDMQPPMKLNNEGVVRAKRLLDTEIAEIERRRTAAGIGPGGTSRRQFKLDDTLPDPETVLRIGTGKGHASGNYSQGKSLDFQVAESGTTPTQRLADDLVRNSQMASAETNDAAAGGLGDDADSFSHLPEVNLDSQFPTWRQQAARVKNGDFEFPDDAPTPEALGRRIARTLGLNADETEQFVAEVRGVLGKSIREQAPKPPQGKQAVKSARRRMVPGDTGKKIFSTPEGQLVNEGMFDPSTQMYQMEGDRYYTHDGGTAPPMGRSAIQDEIDRLRAQLDEAPEETAARAKQRQEEPPDGFEGLDDLDAMAEELGFSLDPEPEDAGDIGTQEPMPEPGGLDDLTMGRPNRKILQGLLA